MADTISSVIRDGLFLTITYASGRVYKRQLGYADLISSIIPVTNFKVLQIYRDSSGDLVVTYEDTNGDEQSMTVSGSGDMTKSIYDPNDDGVIAAAQLDPDVLTATEHTAIGNGVPHHTKYTDAEAVDAVEAAGLILADTKVIEHDPTPAASHTANGEVVTMTGGVGAGLAFGQACYVGTDGKMELALADDAAVTVPATHLCIATIAENDPGLFLVRGWAHDDSWAFDVGLSVYLSKDTAGLITKTMPAKVTGNQVQVLGTALVADTIYWNPSPIVVEYA